MNSTRKQYHGHITRPRISGGKTCGTWEEIGEGLTTAGIKLLRVNSESRAHLGALGFAVLAGKTRLKAELERERSERGESAGLRAAAGAKTAGVARLEAQAQGQALHRVGGSQRRRGEHSGSIRAEREGTLRAEARSAVNFRGGKRGVHLICGGNGS